MSNVPEGFNPEDWRVDQNGDLQPREERVTRSWRRQLEDEAREGKEAARRVAELERQIAIRDAGVSMETPLGELFLKAYDGPVEADAIKAAAVKYGLMQPSPEHQAQIDQALTGHQGSMQAASGAQAQTGGVDHDSELKRIASQFKAVNSGEDAVRALKEYMHKNDPTAVDRLREQLGARH